MEFRAGSANAQSAEVPLRLLFVGGDFARKGGPELVEAFCGGLQSECVLDIVTKDAQPPANWRV